MLTDKDIKAKYKPLFWKNPEKYYAVEVLKGDGFARQICKQCSRPFWSLEPREVCGDPACAKGESFAFIGKSPVKQPLKYAEVWKRFSRMFEDFGYTPINRYPVVARWNPTMDYTNASIAAFQPYVISGEVEPPANPLVIPQFCLRFGDVDNVGITQSHNTGFVMIGQHSFQQPKNWSQNTVFRHIKEWLNKGLGLPDREIIFHEDAWAGGGNLGCCMEFYSRGCELGNQVYMLYEQTPSGVQDLKIKVLDMGMGMERNAWFSQGKNTIYDAAFPKVLNKLLAATGVRLDAKLLARYVPFAGLLNIDEVEDIDRAWQLVADNLGMNVDELKQQILPLRAVYAIAEHARSLLVALNDGSLPSNTGGGYNLRMLARRAFSFIEDNNWNIHLSDVCDWHAEELRELFPELGQNLDDVRRILDVEKSKFGATRQKTKHILARMAKEELDAKSLIKYYDSYGITPETVREEAQKKGIKIKVPDDFYARVAEAHSQPEKGAGAEEQIPAINLEGVSPTEASYFDDWRKSAFNAKVLKCSGKLLVLDESYFYPTSGGQDHDSGEVIANGIHFNVANVLKKGPHIIHILDKDAALGKGDVVACRIDFKRRFQLAQHHTAAHIINAAAKKILGNHINQAGSQKSMDKAHLDITHYEPISDEDLARIEAEANKTVLEHIEVRKMFLPRNEAEKRFGLMIYQGGAVPGKLIRIVEIPGIDAEACGGTHVDNTKEVETIRIAKSARISDSIVRIIFSAGNAAQKLGEHDQEMIAKASELLGVKPSQLPYRAEELFENWKKLRKLVKKGGKPVREEYKLSATREYAGETLAKTAELLKTQPDYILQTLRRFLRDIEAWLK